MSAALGLVAMASGLAFGFLGVRWASGRLVRAKGRKDKGRSGLQTMCAGMHAWVLSRVREETVRREASGIASVLSRGVFAWKRGWMERSACLAGLGGKVSVEAMCTVRAKLAFGFAAAGLVFGAVFSNELAALLCVGGGAFGTTAVFRAFKEEGMRRAKELERSLPEMLEVVSLGLRSGLSFERSLELYYRHFEGGLSEAVSLAHRRWTMGFATREQALRDMAASYDSKLLSRLVENVVRALRFGTSLADGLEGLATEAREVRRARLQEAIAKAPVKMMVPTGTLILPAMLILVLGPVLLELMQGF